MRAAPPVSVECRSGGAWRAAQSALPAAAAGAFVLWASGWREVEGAAALTLAGVVAAVAAVAAWAAARPRAHQLCWDGTHWSIGARTCRVDLMIDLGAWLLVRARPDGGPTGAAALRRTLWLAVTAREAGAAWHGLRAALYSRPPAGGRSGAGADVAQPREP